MLEKLAQHARKRGTDSPAAQEMQNITHPVEGVTPQKPKKATEIKEDKEQ
jgi:hypothetical protein